MIIHSCKMVLAVGLCVLATATPAPECVNENETPVWFN